MQSTGLGLQLLIYYGAVTASRQEREQEGSPRGLAQGPTQCLTKSINIRDLRTHRAA